MPYTKNVIKSVLQLVYIGYRTIPKDQLTHFAKCKKEIELNLGPLYIEMNQKNEITIETGKRMSFKNIYKAHNVNDLI